VARIFKLLSGLRFLEVDVSKPQQQQIVAQCVACVMQHDATTRGDRSVFFSRPKTTGHLTADDLLRICALIKCSSKRDLRFQQIKKEHGVRGDLGFSLVEIEDLRELHKFYSGLDMQSATNVKRMQALLEKCGVSLTKEEDRELKGICAKGVVQPHRRVSDESAANCPVPFDIFLAWMRDIFSSNIGGLARTLRGSADDLQRRTGFIALMQREQEKLQKKVGGGQSADYSKSAGIAWRPKTLGIVPPIGSESGSAFLTSPASYSSTGRSSLATSRRSSGMRTRSQGNKTVGSTPSESRRASSTGRLRAGLEGQQVDGDALEESKLVLKGLPPSEAMLARKAIRACSIVIDDANDIGLGDSRLSPGGSKLTPGGSRLSPNAKVGWKAPQSPGKQRKVKPVQDVDQVVMDAILKLQNGFGEDVEDGLGGLDSD